MAGWTINIRGNGSDQGDGSIGHLVQEFVARLRDHNHRIDYCDVTGENDKDLTLHGDTADPAKETDGSRRSAPNSGMMYDSEGALVPAPPEVTEGGVSNVELGGQEEAVADDDDKDSDLADEEAADLDAASGDAPKSAKKKASKKK